MMKLYPTLDVTLNYQNFGSAWLCILRGNSENVQLAFNGLFNFCATNGELDIRDHLGTVGIFWTDQKAMRRYFFNRHYIPRYVGRHDAGNGKLVREAMRYAQTQLTAMSSCHEAFLDFDNMFMPETYGNGIICAERPDADMKDAILASAFSEKDSEKAVDKAETF